MNMKWTPEGELDLSVFRKAVQQLKYVGKESTHTPGTLCAIPSGVLNHLAKLTSRKPSLYSEGVDKVYPYHPNALRKAGLAPPDFPTMEDLWKLLDENLEIENEKEPNINKKKNRNVYFFVAYSQIGRGIFSKDLMDRECNCSLPSKVNRKYAYEGKCRSG